MSHSLRLMKKIAFAFALPCACVGGDGGSGGGGGGLPPAVPLMLEARLVSATEAQLQWFPSIDDVEVTGYRVYRDGDAIFEVPSEAAVDSDVPPDRESCYTVTALDGDGNESAQSEEACVDPSITWITRVHASRGDLQAVAWSGERFLAVGSEHEVLVSADGREWIRHDKDLQFFGGLNDVLWDGERFVAVGDDLVYTTTDGVDGGATLFVDTGEMSAVAWSGALYVAVGENGGIFTSLDAETFAPQVSGTTEWLHDVVWTGTGFVAVGSGGVVLTSPDGIAWTPQVSTTTAALSGVASSDAGLVAVGTGVALTSSDGVSWTVHEQATGSYTSVAFAEHLGRFVASGYGGQVSTSVDGVAWAEPVSLTPQSVLDDIAVGDGTVVVVGTEGVIYSAMDPATDAWTPRSSGAQLFNVLRTSEGLIAFGGAGRLLTSPDGIAWSHTDTGNRDDYTYDFAASDDRYVLVGQRYVLSSADLVTWDVREWLGATSSCDGVVWTGAMFVAVCSGGAIRLSPDGIRWEAILLDDYSTLFTDVAWSGSVLVAASSTGMMRSTDGRAWTPVAVPDMAVPRAVVWTGAMFVAVGNGGTIAHSEDGAMWTAAVSGVTDNLTAITWTGEELVAIGPSGKVLSSPDADTWTVWPSQAGFYELTGVAATADGRLAVTTSDGEIFTVR